MQQIISNNFPFIINLDRSAELPFYEQLTVIKTKAFRGYAILHKVEIIERKIPVVKLEASKPSIKDLLSDFLNETKSFKYQITVKVSLKKTQAQWRN